MSIHTTFPQDEWDVALRDDLRGYVVMYKEEFSKITEDIRNGTYDEAKDLRWLLKELEKARKELVSLEKRLSDEADADPTQVFDFDKTRDTIGGKLDSLRASYGPKGVSGQS
ncbi:MAG: hypothetical protein ACPG5U_04985 [Planktomarina sp.]